MYYIEEIIDRAANSWGVMLFGDTGGSDTSWDSDTTGTTEETTETTWESDTSTQTETTDVAPEVVTYAQPTQTHTYTD